MKYLIMFLAVLAAIYLLSELEPPQVIAAESIYVIDGDTIEVDGERYRLVGFDTPETYRAECQSEKRLGSRATERLRELLASATEISFQAHGDWDKYGRGLATLSVDSEDVGNMLIDEDLARRYEGGARYSWCR